MTEQIINSILEIPYIKIIFTLLSGWLFFYFINKLFIKVLKGKLDKIISKSYENKCKYDDLKIEETSDEECTGSKIIWFNAKNNTNLYYRFKVFYQKEKNTENEKDYYDLFVFINKKDISVYHRIRLLCWFLKQLKHKQNSDNVYKLPDFFVNVYILPKLTEMKHNLKLV